MMYILPNVGQIVKNFCPNIISLFLNVQEVLESTIVNDEYWSYTHGGADDHNRQGCSVRYLSSSMTRKR